MAASPSTDEEKESESPSRDGIVLPRWEEGESIEAFDVRIWPESVMFWLEQENLRDLIADPSTPDDEKQSLKRILAMQNAWRVRS